MIDVRTRVWFFLGMLLCVGGGAFAKGVVEWDFTKGRHGWTANRHVDSLRQTAEGLAFESIGDDPWIEGPAVDLPASGRSRVTVRMKSQANSAGELFYGPGFEAGRSVRFSVQADGTWREYQLLIVGTLGKATRFRLDPAAARGSIVVGSIRVESLPNIEPPSPLKPVRPGRGNAEPVVLRSGSLAIRHYGGGWGDFVVEADGEEMAAGYQGETIGLLFDDKPQWLGLKEADVSVDSRDAQRLAITARLRDSRGGRWEVRRDFAYHKIDGTVFVETTYTTDQDREVISLAWLTLFPGLGTFGQTKSQGLLAGLEYLADEASSSKADVTVAAHDRRAPDPVKITFPLMAVAAQGRYVGLVWQPSDLTAAMYDSPDRTYGSGAHMMGVSAPTIGPLRFENHPVAHTPFKLQANRPVAARVLVIGGKGRTIVPAVQHYVRLRGLPEVPRFEGGLKEAVRLLAHGWLDSKANEGGVFRHAVWGSSFRAGPAADAAMYMDWLSSHTADDALAERLGRQRDLALSKLPSGSFFSSGVSHVRPPVPPLVFGQVGRYVRQRTEAARDVLRTFDADGVKRYRPGKVDYGKTHFASHANGLTGHSVADILEAASLSADKELVKQALALLDKQTTAYAGTVPRGAQTWEVPLHTPDILASAHMVKAYTLGYMLSAEARYLEQARYWAWTGVPFVYLHPPTDGPVGLYATIAVLGATNWKAPVWFGRPVQWCGLVYGSSLHLLSQHDEDGPWGQIARGITAAGLQMTWTTSDQDRQGLLPDYFELRPQISDGPAINPGTVGAHMPELFDAGKLYDVRKLESAGWVVHCPCAIRNVREQTDHVTFEVDGWTGRESSVLVLGVAAEPATVQVVSLDGGSQRISESRISFDDSQKLVTIAVRGKSRIQVHH